LLGLGREAEARAALDEVLRLDRAHATARDLLAADGVKEVNR
jgi:cytochrome c-type biogenesis protein CcmH/NrfG